MKKLSNNDIKNKKSKNFLEQVTNNDNVSITGLLSLTNPFIQYSRINLLKNFHIYEGKFT